MEQEQPSGEAHSKSSKFAHKIKKQQLRKPIYITDYYKQINESQPQRPSPKKMTCQNIDSIQMQIETIQNKKIHLTAQLNNISQNIDAMREQFGNFMIKSKKIMAREIIAHYNLIRTTKLIPDKRFGFIAANGFKRQGQAKKILLAKIQKIQMKLSRGQLKRCQKLYLQQQLQNLKQRYAAESLQCKLFEEQLRLIIEQQCCMMHKQGWTLQNKRYIPLQLIGKGGFSEVYKGFDLQRQIYVAIKLSSADEHVYSMSLHKDYIRHVRREYQTHKHLKHSNIACLYDVIQAAQSTICFVLQYCQGIDLAKYLRSNKCLSENQSKTIIKQIFSALCYMHNAQVRVIHYDLKPQNIIFHDGLVKIVDFGLCKTIQGLTQQIALTSKGAGTLAYLPPQTLLESDPMISQKVDIWSTGVILHQLLTGQKPSRSPYGGTYISLNLTPKATQFILALLQIDVSKRLTAKEAFQHQFLADAIIQ